MELIISILIYLGTLVPNNSYTMEDVHKFETENKTQIEAITNDGELSSQILDANHDNFKIDQTLNTIEVWEDEELIYD